MGKRARFVAASALAVSVVAYSVGCRFRHPSTTPPKRYVSVSAQLYWKHRIAGWCREVGVRKGNLHWVWLSCCGLSRYRTPLQEVRDARNEEIKGYLDRFVAAKNTPTRQFPHVKSLTSRTGDSVAAWKRWWSEHRETFRATDVILRRHDEWAAAQPLARRNYSDLCNALVKEERHNILGDGHSARGDTR